MTISENKTIFGCIYKCVFYLLFEELFVPNLPISHLLFLPFHLCASVASYERFLYYQLHDIISIIALQFSW